uniref:Uncharacterized protein n=1 Tax=Panagrolaimus sp. PS1159 TaxID=55785 RepID=A0AC35GVB9_9BILA
ANEDACSDVKAKSEAA